ncbi:MAG: DUF3795 domain-containing protein [Methanobacterium sp.]|uniref:DUF3795 domain-containing protein n=1 Tax=Methanobacterium sp. TaxID=2164 RepID=UPI003D64B660|nr:DUF3795 domain-containing protein [Methanobacterium sp.]
MGRIPNETAPCGVFCGACPSYEKSCLGCGSEEHNHGRKSKWSCKIRKCCFEDKNLNFCIDCDEFPCNLIEKLKNSHPGDDRFKYRHEIYDNLKKIHETGVENWITQQENRFTCPKCNGRVLWYNYKCNECGYECSLKSKKIK